jgi:hypothetical protein
MEGIQDGRGCSRAGVHPWVEFCQGYQAGSSAPFVQGIERVDAEFESNFGIHCLGRVAKLLGQEFSNGEYLEKLPVISPWVY